MRAIQAWKARAQKPEAPAPEEPAPDAPAPPVPAPDAPEKWPGLLDGQDTEAPAPEAPAGDLKNLGSGISFRTSRAEYKNIRIDDDGNIWQVSGGAGPHRESIPQKNVFIGNAKDQGSYQKIVQQIGDQQLWGDKGGFTGFKDDPELAKSILASLAPFKGGERDRRPDAPGQPTPDAPAPGGFINRGDWERVPRDPSQPQVSAQQPFRNKKTGEEISGDEFVGELRKLDKHVGDLALKHGWKKVGGTRTDPTGFWVNPDNPQEGLSEDEFLARFSSGQPPTPEAPVPPQQPAEHPDMPYAGPGQQPPEGDQQPGQPAPVPDAEYRPGQDGGQQPGQPPEDGVGHVQWEGPGNPNWDATHNPDGSWKQRPPWQGGGQQPGFGRMPFNPQQLQGMVHPMLLPFIMPLLQRQGGGGGFGGGGFGGGFGQRPPWQGGGGGFGGGGMPGGDWDTRAPWARQRPPWQGGGGFGGGFPWQGGDSFLGGNSGGGFGQRPPWMTQRERTPSIAPPWMTGGQQQPGGGRITGGPVENWALPLDEAHGQPGAGGRGSSDSRWQQQPRGMGPGSQAHQRWIQDEAAKQFGPAPGFGGGQQQPGGQFGLTQDASGKFGLTDSGIAPQPQPQQPTGDEGFPLDPGTGPKTPFAGAPMDRMVSVFPGLSSEWIGQPANPNDPAGQRAANQAAAQLAQQFGGSSERWRGGAGRGMSAGLGQQAKFLAPAMAESQVQRARAQYENPLQARQANLAQLMQRQNLASQLGQQQARQVSDDWYARANRQQREGAWSNQFLSSLLTPLLTRETAGFGGPGGGGFGGGQFTSNLLQNVLGQRS